MQANYNKGGIPHAAAANNVPLAPAGGTIGSRSSIVRTGGRNGAETRTPSMYTWLGVVFGEVSSWWSRWHRVSVVCPSFAPLWQRSSCRRVVGDRRVLSLLCNNKVSGFPSNHRKILIISSIYATMVWDPASLRSEMKPLYLVDSCSSSGRRTQRHQSGSKLDTERNDDGKRIWCGNLAFPAVGDRSRTGVVLGLSRQENYNDGGPLGYIWGLQKHDAARLRL